MANQQETLQPTQAHQRLRQIGAVFKRDYSTSAEQVYYSSTTNLWVTVTAAARGAVKLSYSKACPCEGG